MRQEGSHSQKFRKLENPSGITSVRATYAQGKEITWRITRMNVLVKSLYCLRQRDGYFSQPLGGPLTVIGRCICVISLDAAHEFLISIQMCCGNGTVDRVTVHSRSDRTGRSRSVRALPARGCWEVAIKLQQDHSTDGQFRAETPSLHEFPVGFLAEPYRH